MLDQLRQYVIGETVDVHIARFFDTDATAVRFLKDLLTSSSFMVPFVTFVRRKTDLAVAGQNTVVAKVSKKKPVAVMEAYGDIIEFSLI